MLHLGFPAAILGLCAAAAVAGAAPVHPLDPLSATELERSRELVAKSRRWPADLRFVTVELDEPADKRRVRGHRPGDPVERRSRTTLYSIAENTTYEVLTSLTAGRVLDVRALRGTQTLWQRADDELVAKIIQADPRWARLLEDRPDVAAAAAAGTLEFSAFGTGQFVTTEGSRADHRRFIVVVYAGEVELPGLTVHVDLTAGKVLEFNVEPHARVKSRLVQRDDAPSPPVPIDTAATEPAPTRLPLRIDGHAVSWGPWRFRFHVGAREGLVLHDVRVVDGARERPVLYRGSLSEMVVPYNSTDGNWYWKNIFDAGEAGMALFGARPRAVGVDDPPGAHYFAAVVNDVAGRPLVVPRAVSLRERDGGVLWRHGVRDMTEAHAVAGARSTQLVLSYYATIGNYDYAWNWVFHPDGTLQVEVELTGELNVRVAFRPRDVPGFPDPAYRENYFGTLVEPHVEALNHQHYFSFRLDLDVDGAENSVAEMNAVLAPLGPRNPYGNAFYARMTPLARESDARRPMDPAQNRHWMVLNEATTTTLGHHPAYALMPGGSSGVLSSSGSVLRERAAWLEAAFWATPFAPRELFASGDYPAQAPPRDGLARYSEQDRSLERTDVVVWYTFGVTHVPRPEEWPLMSVHRTGFKLVPWGFFVRNPAL